MVGIWNFLFGILHFSKMCFNFLSKCWSEVYIRMHEMLGHALYIRTCGTMKRIKRNVFRMTYELIAFCYIAVLAQVFSTRITHFFCDATVRRYMRGQSAAHILTTKCYQNDYELAKKKSFNSTTFAFIHIKNVDANNFFLYLKKVHKHTCSWKCSTVCFLCVFAAFIEVCQLIY